MSQGSECLESATTAATVSAILLLGVGEVLHKSVLG